MMMGQDTRPLLGSLQQPEVHPRQPAAHVRRSEDRVVYLVPNVVDGDVCVGGQQAGDVCIVHPQKVNGSGRLQEFRYLCGGQQPHSALAKWWIVAGRELIAGDSPFTFPLHFLIHFSAVQRILLRAALQAMNKPLQHEGVDEDVVVRVEGPGHVGTVAGDPVEGGERFVAQQVVVVAVVTLYSAGTASYLYVKVSHTMRA